MKKLILILLSFNVNLMLAQSKYTLEQAQNSNDPKVVANFIMNNPNHSETTNLKQKLAHMMMDKNSLSSSVSKTKTYNNNKNVVNNKNNKSKVSAEDQKTADILNHILNSNDRTNEAYVSVNNLSQCPIVVNFEGNKKYQLSIGANSVGRILIDKGNYTISSKVCNAQYKNQRAIQKDWELTLNLSK